MKRKESSAYEKQFQIKLQRRNNCGALSTFSAFQPITELVVDISVAGDQRGNS